MKQYKIFKHPSGTNEVVKQGWSWPAFFFNFIWAIVKKQLGLGFGTFGGMFALGFIIGLAGGGDLGGALINIVSIIISIIFGMNGNSWREKNLVSRGYEPVDTVTAANQEGALALYMKVANA